MKGGFGRIGPAIAAACLLAAPTAFGEDAEQTQLLLEDLRTFTEVFNQVRKNYVTPMDDLALLNAAIGGIVDELDDYSEFIDAESFTTMDDQSRGRYGGIGIDVEFHHEQIVVTGVVEGGPANRAGIRRGDLVTAVSGRPVEGRRLSESMDAMRGRPDTEVEVRVQTPGQPARDLTVVRAYIPARSVESRFVEGRYGLLRISHFHDETGSEFEAVLNSMAAREDRKMEGVIIDVRGNRGGVLTAAVAVADGFLEQGLIVDTRTRNRNTDQAFDATPGEWLPGIPVVVLVDENTASAAEVLAGALQGNGRAQVAGVQTFGKGSVQSVLRLYNGSALRLTTARYFTASGKSIDGIGITPDIALDPDPDGPVLEELAALLDAASAD